MILFVVLLFLVSKEFLTISGDPSGKGLSRTFKKPINF